MNIRAIGIYAGTALTGASACLAAAVIAASPAEAPTLSDCKGACPVITPTPVAMVQNSDHQGWHTDREGVRPTLKP